MEEAQLIRSWIDFACDKNEVPELKNKIDFVFNQRLLKKLGDACYYWSKARGTIRLSSKIWEIIDDDLKRETVIHEACHIIANYKLNADAEHGVHWKAAMYRCDLLPNVKACVDIRPLLKPIKKYTITTCNQIVKCVISQKQFNQIKKSPTSVHRCNLCQCQFGYHDLEDVE